MVAEPTRGQLERALGQRIQTLFRDRVGQRPSRAVCQMFDESLTIVLEETVSPPERTLMETGQGALAKQLRSQLNEAMKPALKSEIAAILDSEVMTVLLDSDLDSGYSSVTAILQQPPLVRDPQSIPKLRRERFDSDLPESG